MAQTLGFEAKNEGEKVLRLRKALCGLRQAPRAWNAKLDKTLISLGFKKWPYEHAVYKSGVGESLLLVGVYVDDLIMTGTSGAGIKEFKSQMKHMFSMSDLGLLSYYLGIEVSQTSQGISICQPAYAAKVLEKCGMAECNPCQTPMETRLELSKESTISSVDATHYKSMVGSLRYPVNT